MQADVTLRSHLHGSSQIITKGYCALLRTQPLNVSGSVSSTCLSLKTYSESVKSLKTHLAQHESSVSARPVSEWASKGVSWRDGEKQEENAGTIKGILAEYTCPLLLKKIQMNQWLQKKQYQRSKRFTPSDVLRNGQIEL